MFYRKSNFLKSRLLLTPSGVNNSFCFLNCFYKGLVFISFFYFSTQAFAQQIINGNFEDNTLNWQEEYKFHCASEGKTSNRIANIFNWACNTPRFDVNGVGFDVNFSKKLYTMGGVINPHQNRNTHFHAFRHRRVFYSNQDSFYRRQAYSDGFYLALQFTKPLVIGKTYRLRYLSCIGMQADDIHEMDSSNIRSYSVLRLKVGISDNNSSFGDSVGVTNAWIIPNTWQKHHFTFVANRAANFLTFDFSKLTVHNPRWHHTGSTGYPCRLNSYECLYDVKSYCAFDNFVLEEVCPLDLGNDTTLCEGESMILDAKNTGSKYLWSKGDTTQTIQVNQAGKYWVNMDDGKGCSNSDTIEVKMSPKPNGFLGKDTVVCNGNPLLLQTNLEGQHLWNTNQNSSSISVNQSGLYSVHINNNGCINHDTILITINQKVDIGNDTILCENNVVILQSNLNMPLLWSTGETSQTIDVNQSGDYWIEVYQNGCVNTDSVSIVFLPIKYHFLGADKTLCDNEVLTINSNITGNTFLWNTGGVDSFIVVNSPGQYHISVADNYCIHKDTINILAEPKLRADFPFQMSICKDSLFTLRTILPNAKWYNLTGDLLSNDSILTISIQNPETFFVSSGYQCRYMDSIMFLTHYCNPINYNFYFPNAFTPNQNPPNEVYNPQAEGWERQEMSIYNRWGELVFKSNYPNEGWDGVFKGKPSPEGVYIVKLGFKALDNVNQTNPYYYWNGTVHLLR